MSDKSFGDHVNRNIVKNPLLSSAVTGLSLEDLTHKAVLLPATPPQGQISRQDQAQGSQVHTLEQAVHDKPIFPSGDAFTNISLSNTPLNTKPNILDSKNYDINQGTAISTQSKATLKSEDDFDVNEYIARLQGTRYVSAPLHSHIKDDANLEAEESLEEINLNEQNEQVEVQQSLTADIAQNFSQLPAVLPHVASAVFSSFSNMLSMKSREQTPDDAKIATGYQNVQFEKPDAGVALMGVEETAPKDFGLPPKEPLTSGYRIASKKKYAQIPGLSAGDGVQNLPYNAPINQTVPSFFTPAETVNVVNETAPIAEKDNEAVNRHIPTYYTPEQKDNAQSDAANNAIQSQSVNTYNIFNPNQVPSSINPTHVTDSKNVASYTMDFDAIQQGSENVASIESHIFTPTQKDLSMQPGPPIIPPPPMFSGIKTDSQTSVGKAVLPPSVARRISANQPLIKPQMPMQTFTENIFVPTIPETSQINIPSGLPPLPSCIDKSVPSLPPPQSVPFSYYTPSTDISPMSVIRSSSSAPSESLQASSIGPPLFAQNTAGIIGIPNIPSPSIATLPMSATGAIGSVPPASNIGQAFSSTAPYIPSAPAASSNAPTMFYSTQQMGSSMQSPDVPHPITQYPHDFVPEPPKPVAEPPKASANVNFRMTKKRPQYYSGPIEGVGAISNNVKPVLAPVMPPVPSLNAHFQGSFFTPAQQPHVEDLYAAPDKQDIAPFDLSKPVEQPFTPFHTSQPQSYEQNYNTAFDLSRPTTDEFESPKQENKGFGIIGSLKSKLSSIDINKIQSTVTTFFDPAYNAKVEPTAQNAPYAQQQYEQYSHGQSSFEITVPGVEQNQYGYQHGYNNPTNQYYQATNTFDYTSNEGHVFSGFPDPFNIKPYPGPPINVNVQQPPISNYSQENIPQAVEKIIYDEDNDRSIAFYNPATALNTQDEPLAVKHPLSMEKIEKVYVFDDAVNKNVEAHGVIGDNGQKTAINPQVGIEKDNKHFTKPGQAATFFDSPLVGAEIKSHDEFTPNKPQIYLPYNQPLELKVAPAASYFDTPVGMDNELAEKMAQLAMAEEIAIRNTPFEAIDLQLGLRSEPNIEESTILKVVGIKPVVIPSQDVIISDHLVHKVNEFSQVKASLLESLTTEELPVVGVSKAPLFGIAPIVTEKSQGTSDVTDVKNVSLFDVHKESKPHLERQTSIGFFDDSSLEVKLQEEPAKPTIGFNISDVKNVLLIDPPEEKLGTILKKNVSYSMLKDLPEAENKSKNLSQDRDSTWNTDKDITTSKDNVNVLFDRASGFFDHIVPSENVEEKVSTTDTIELASDFNICETCREVNVPEDKGTENVTRQLIENINSSIQLTNPVEAVLTERYDSIENNEPDNRRLDDIAQIVEDPYETFQIQSATELLNDVDAARVNTYGWTSDQLAYATTDKNYSNIAAATDSNAFSFKPGDQYNMAIDSEYTFKIDPNAIGFFGDNSLFFDNVPNNASDELKAEFKTSHDDITVPPRQLSLPSAPPAEDSKSDEAGVLDVLSIEQDAKKDFPLEEEFIIEPSETDDDKIEYKERKRSSEDSISDTFADRIEKFKNNVCGDSNDDLFNIKWQEDATKSIAASNYEVFCDKEKAPPPKSMASYFDTGNYAVETHYRNSLTSPVNILKYQGDPSEAIMRIPPGFENEFNRRQSRSGPYSYADQDPLIPETSTQTRTTITPTFSTSLDGGNTRDADLAAQAFGATMTIPHTGAVEEHVSHFPTAIKQREKIFVEENDKNELNILKDARRTDPMPLPDPINFFASNTEAPSEADPDNFNRLASYFSMTPAQPDHSKSFFELSQSQNHYRHGLQNPDTTNVLLNQGQIDRTIKENIQNLMQDLTSAQNIKFDDTIVRTVNYFSVEQISDTGAQIDKRPFNIKNIDNLDSVNKNIIELDSANIKDTDCINVIDSCEYCNKLDSNYKVKTAANDSDKASGQPNMNDNAGSNQEKSVAVDFGHLAMDEEAQEGLTMVHESRSSSEYTPVRHHWFYRVDVEEKSVWRGFSMTDSNALEQAYRSPDLKDDTLVSTDGGRFDVNVLGRLRIAVYWKEKPTNVRRCSWFYKGTTDARYVPYTEAVADKLEEEYRHGVTTGEWHRRLVLPNSELVVMHGPAVMVHFLHAGSADSSFSSPPFLFGKRVYRNPPAISVCRDQRRDIDHLVLVVHGAGEYKRHADPATSRPRVVRRGHEESEIEDSEPSSIDHLLLLCHGVGSACDMRFRSVEEVVEDFRATSLQLLQSHYRNSYDNGVVSRVEVLPISWHEQLHAGETGVDKRLNKVTLESIPRLRAFTNHTVLDVLFYTSPVYHQSIINTVCFELNRVYSLFKMRNPAFKGNVSLGGHSLGSVILYDLLCNQKPEAPLTQKSSARKTFLPGTAEQHMSLENYPQLGFPPAALYALGSPIAIFECIRGVESLGLQFALPTCRSFFNIFHPYDPIAYRIEPLINPILQDAKPYLIPHHKGRKRMHLELKDTMARVGADLKQKLLESLRATWNKWKSTPPPDGQLEKVVEEEMEKEQLCEENKDEQINAELTTPEMLGQLNCGRRVDYVLQEAPLEMINEYLFAMSSHVGYWESEDTMLLMLREIYSSLGVQPDSTVPQQSLTVTRTRQDEATVLNEKDNPSTSRAGS